MVSVTCSLSIRGHVLLVSCGILLVKQVVEKCIFIGLSHKFETVRQLSNSVFVLVKKSVSFEYLQLIICVSFGLFDLHGVQLHLI